MRIDLKDNTRQRLYTAERAWSLDEKDAKRLLHFDHVEAAVEYLQPIADKVGVTLPTIEFGGHDTNRKGGETLGTYFGLEQKIVLRPNGRDSIVLLHEWSHHRTRMVPAPSHGGEFCRSFLSDVELAHGRDAAEGLREHLEAKRVLWSLRDQIDAAWKQVYRTESDWDRWVDPGEPWHALVVAEVGDGQARYDAWFRRAGSTHLAVHASSTSAVQAYIKRSDLRYVQAPMYRKR